MGATFERERREEIEEWFNATWEKTRGSLSKDVKRIKYIDWHCEDDEEHF